MANSGRIEAFLVLSGNGPLLEDAAAALIPLIGQGTPETLMALRDNAAVELFNAGATQSAPDPRMLAAFKPVTASDLNRWLEVAATSLPQGALREKFSAMAGRVQALYPAPETPESLGEAFVRFTESGASELLNQVEDVLQKSGRVEAAAALAALEGDVTNDLMGYGPPVSGEDFLNTVQNACAAMPDGDLKTAFSGLIRRLSIAPPAPAPTSARMLPPKP